MAAPHLDHEQLPGVAVSDCCLVVFAPLEEPATAITFDDDGAR